MNEFEIGERVVISSPGHLLDGMAGYIIYYGSFLGTWGVEVGTKRYGFLPHELVRVNQ